MIFQGDVSDIDPKSSVGHIVNFSNESSMEAQTRDDSELFSQTMQELHIDGPRENSPAASKAPESRQAPRSPSSSAGLLQPDQSSSRLTDMLHGVSPRRDESNTDFRNCPSAVPSPLHRGLGGRVPLPQIAPVLQPPASSRQPFVPSSIDDHFFMTNEHMDVMGKSMWDHTESLRKELIVSAGSRHAKLISVVEGHVQEIKMQVDSVNEKADRTIEKGHNITTKLDEMFEFIKNDVMGALHIQDTKMTDLELGIKEIQKTVQNMQKTLDQKQSDPKASQQPTSTPQNSSLPSLVGYYSSTTESPREAQPHLSNPPDHRNSHGNASHVQEPHNGAHAGYGNYGQSWAPRGGYQGRNSKGEGGYVATNPYHFGPGANGAANGGHYSNGFNNGYTYN